MLCTDGRFLIMQHALTTVTPLHPENKNENTTIVCFLKYILQNSLNVLNIKTVSHLTFSQF